MAQLNLKLTDQFENDLEKYMKIKGIKSKSDAVRSALREIVSIISTGKKTDYKAWLGMGLKNGIKPKGRFKSEDDL